MKRQKKSTKGWSPLKAGAIVDVIAPASKCSTDELQKGIVLLEKWGLKPRVSPQIFGDNLLHAQSDEVRWNQLKKALLAKDSSVIWCARGGYGSMKLLPPLRKMKKPAQQKFLVGLSDITSLNVFFNQNWKWPTLHAPILSRMGRGDLPPSTHEEIQRILFGEQDTVTFSLEPFNEKAQRSKMISGSVVGGNWTTLMASVGTPFSLKGKGNILFLEDIGERGYRLDRFWEQWEQAQFWSSLEALVLGDFTEGDEPNGSNTIWEVLRMRAEKYKKPVYRGLPSGHGNIQRPLPLGLVGEIKKQGDSTLLRVGTGCRI